MKFLFDLGGVFFDWDPKFFFTKIIFDKDEMDFFLTKVCNDEWNLAQDSGRSIEDGERDIIKKFPEYENLIRQYYPNHRKMIKGTFKSSVDILIKLKQNNYECFVLSNWSSETFIDIPKEFKFMNNFDGLLISGEDKLVKPDPKIYLLAIDRFNLDPQNTVFIDDKLVNINAAKKLGFKTIHLTNPNIIESEINKFIK
tara:strand:- start:308 stop:901 length:594 start_codon:yes stop_codon:yes gene_type:complete